MFYNRLERACCAKGISVAKACTAVGLHRSSYLYWKHGKRPNRGNIELLAAYVGVTPEYLLNGNSEDDPTSVGITAA